jgi:antitoxin component YwqK of YwqJK toxin-antitoxin module
MKLIHRLAIVSLLLSVSVSLMAQDSLNITDSKGLKQGFWRKLNAEKQVVYEGRFVNDKPVGEFCYFYPDGKLKTVMTYKPGNDEVLSVSYHTNGKKMAEGVYKQKQKTGEWRYYNDLDILMSEEFYDNGKSIGTWKNYFDDGKLLEVFSWKDGQKDSLWTQYFTDGKIRMTAGYVAGKLEGDVKYYYPGGSLMVEGQYLHDAKDGIWTSYKEDGAAEVTTVYSNGKMLQQTIHDKEREKELYQDDMPEDAKPIEK